MVKQNGHGYTSGNGVLAPLPPLWAGVGWCVVGLVCGYDRISSAEFGDVVVLWSNFDVRSSCITLYLSASQRLHNQKETWGGYHGLGRGGRET